MTEKVEKAAAAPKVATKKAPQILVAIHKIDGVIEPGTPFTGPAKDLKELLDLGAAREADGDAEAALFEKLGDSVATLPNKGGDDIAAALG